MLIIFYYPNIKAESHEIRNLVVVRVQCNVHHFKDEGCGFPFTSNPLVCSFTFKSPLFLPLRILNR